jgi:hypothetical protein
LPVFGLSVLALLLTAARPTERRTDSGFFEGGSIELRLQDAAGSAIDTGTLNLEIVYGRVDPLNPTRYQTTVAAQSTQKIAAMIHRETRLLTLQGLSLRSNDGSLMIAMDRKALEPLRTHARTGAELVLIKTEKGFEGKTVLPEREDYELPARPTGAGLSYSDADVLDLIRLDDIEDSLLRIKAVSSASNAFYQELIALAQLTPSIDAPRLQLLLDGTAYPAPSLAALRQKLRELPEGDASAERWTTLASNLALGERLAPLSNRLFMVGLSKIKSLAWPEAETLLQRWHSTGESSELIFGQVLDRLGGSFEALQPEQKLRFFSLAARNNAPTFAVAIGRDWFINDSDKSITSLIELLRQIRPGNERDELSRLALVSTGPVSVAELAALTTPVRSESLVLEIFRTLASRISALSASQVLTLVSQRESGDLRDSLLLSAAEVVAQFDAEGLRNLFLACSSWASRDRLLAISQPKIVGSAAGALAEILLVLPMDPQRDILLAKAVRMQSKLSTKELLGLVMASVSETTAIEILDFALDHLEPFKVADATQFSDSLYKPGFSAEVFRDRMLLQAAGAATDLSRENLDQLLGRASNDLIRTKITQIAESRIQKP